MTPSAREIAKELFLRLVDMGQKLDGEHKDDPMALVPFIGEIEQALLTYGARVREEALEEAAKVAELSTGAAKCPRCGVALVTDYPSAKVSAKIRALKEGKRSRTKKDTSTFKSTAIRF